MASRRVIITRDRVNSVIGSITQLVGKQVLVGIPDANNSRQQASSPGPINNASLGYIHEFGSPAKNIPARPFLIPGVRNSTPQVMPHLRGACAAALDGKPATADKELVAAGLIAEASAKREISTGNFVPLQPETVAQRYRSRDTKSQRASEIHYAQLIAGGATPAAAQSAAGIRPLINTGQLRNSITSVVRKNK